MDVPGRMASRVSAARRRRFVGRIAELELFQSALVTQELPFYLLYLYGPGGVGKTALLVEYAALCDQTQIPVIYLDGRNVQPSPQSFLEALRLAMGLDPTDSPPRPCSGRPTKR